MHPTKQDGGVPFVEEPMTNEEALALCDKNDMIKVRVRVPFSLLFADEDRTSSADPILEKLFVNEHLANEIVYNPVGIASPSGEEKVNDIILEVTASLEEMAAEDEDDMEDVAGHGYERPGEAELDEIDPNPDHDPND